MLMAFPFLSLLMGSLWPILGMSHFFSPFMIAHYFRSIKPNEANEFIQDFME